MPCSCIKRSSVTEECLEFAVTFLIVLGPLWVSFRFLFFKCVTRTDETNFSKNPSDTNDLEIDPRTKSDSDSEVKVEDCKSEVKPEQPCKSEVKTEVKPEQPNDDESELSEEQLPWWHGVAPCAYAYLPTHKP